MPASMHSVPPGTSLDRLRVLEGAAHVNTAATVSGTPKAVAESPPKSGERVVGEALGERGCPYPPI
jgi:hypothetical protein